MVLKRHWNSWTSFCGGVTSPLALESLINRLWVYETGDRKSYIVPYDILWEWVAWSTVIFFVFHSQESICDVLRWHLWQVRLYQDCLFMKMPGFGVTNWHSDLNMVPIDTNSFVTVWIPLRTLHATDSSLHFASGSVHSQNCKFKIHKRSRSVRSLFLDFYMVITLFTVLHCIP